MFLPMVGMSLLYVATFARITRGSMIETLNSNFIPYRSRQRLKLPLHHYKTCAKTCTAPGGFVHGASICRDYYRFSCD